MSGVDIFTIPTELTTCPQWVVWRYGEMRSNGKHEKVPYSPRSGRKALTSDATTWGTFQDAKHAYSLDQYDGVGFVISPPYVGVDLDGCRDKVTGEIADWARDIISQLNSYTEVSPSSTGVHILLRGTLPPGARRRNGVEMYDSGRFFTVTGQHTPGTPTTVEHRDSELRAVHAQVFPTKERSSTRQAADVDDIDDAEVLRHCRRGKNAAKFQRLWEGNTSDYDGDHSRADAALCGMLARWTQDEEQIDRIFRQAGLYREEKWDYPHRASDGATYGQMTIELAIGRAAKASAKRQFQTATHAHDWQRRSETPRERSILLHQIAQDIQERVRAHLKAKESDTLLVIAAPPGVGKSHAVAELGAHTVTHPLGTFNLAWIAPRKDMIDSVSGLQRYHRREGCTPENCPDSDLHALYAAKGYNTWAVHKSHPTPCAYMQQIWQEGSTVYQIPHVTTPYPTGHKDGVVVDELDPTQWLQEREITTGRINAALPAFQPETVAAYLLRAMTEMLETCPAGIHGRAVFDALDRCCEGQLVDCVEALAYDSDATNPRPFQAPDGYGYDARAQTKTWPPVVLPHLLRALRDELPMWSRGGEWNSCLRVGVTRETEETALYITERRQFIEPDDGNMPPRVLLDGTADDELLRRLFDGDTVSIVRPNVDPPPHMRHIAVRTGTRYGMWSLTKSVEDRARTVAQVVFLLRVLGLDPNGEKRTAGKVGLITFKDCVPLMRRALGIPQGRTGHFWGMRGSNSLEDCEILLVVGTPTLHPDDVYRMARALYHSDLTPVDRTAQRVYGVWHYDDWRMQRLSDYLIRAELTQCAHRNRPLRHDSRIVLTLCIGDIDYLPATTRVTQFPQLTIEGERHDEMKATEDDVALTEAVERIIGRGEALTVRSLADEVRPVRPIRLETIAEWLREQRGGAG